MWLLRATLLFEGLVRAAGWNEFRKLGKLFLHRQSFLATHCFNFPQHLLQFILLQKLWFSGDSYFFTVFLHLCPIFSHFLYWTYPCPYPQVDNVVIVQSLNHVQLFVTPWIAACQAFLISLSPILCSNSCPLSHWYHPAISSSAAHFSSCPLSFSGSESFPMSQLFIKFIDHCLGTTNVCQIRDSGQGEYDS